MKEKQVSIKVFESTREKVRIVSPLVGEGHMELIDRLVTKEHERQLKKLKSKK